MAEGGIVDQEIRCKNCGKLLGIMKANSPREFEMREGNRRIHVYQAQVVVIDCPRCGATRDICLPS